MLPLQNAKKKRGITSHPPLKSFHAFLSVVVKTGVVKLLPDALDNNLVKLKKH